MQIGDKLRRLRLQRGLTQEELADRCELSKSFISLLERDLTSPSLDTLADLLESLGSDLPTFFREKDEKLVFGSGDIFVKEDPELMKGMIRWLIPSAQKNQMEPILVEMGPGGETTEDGLFSIETVACLGCCSLAPVLSINGRVYGKLDRKSLTKILNEYKAKG